MKTLIYSIFLLLILPTFTFPQTRKASGYIDQIPDLPTTINEARSRLSPQDEDSKVQAVIKDIDINSDTTQPLTVDEINDPPGNNTFLSSTDDYVKVRKNLQQGWTEVEDSIVVLVTNPKLAFQNAIVAIGEERVRELDECKDQSINEHRRKKSADTSCASIVEQKMMGRRDTVASGYLASTTQRWVRLKNTVRIFLQRQESMLDSVRPRNDESAGIDQAKRVDATLLAVVNLLLQIEEDVTKSVVHAGARE